MVSYTNKIEHTEYDFGEFNEFHTNNDDDG